MKKLLVVLALAMASFSFQASAAALTWGAINGTSANATSGAAASGQSLFGAENGLGKNVLVNATWEFLLSASGQVLVNVSSLQVIPTWLTTVELDGVAMTQVGGPTNGGWIFNGLLGAGSHTITLGGTTNGINSGYQLNVQTPIPAAVWLFGSALMGLTGISRRKSAKA